MNRVGMDDSVKRGGGRISRQQTQTNRGKDRGRNQGRRPRGGLGGRSPQNLRWGKAHALVPPIFREVVHSFIHFGYFYIAPSSPLLLRGAPDYSTDTVSEFHAEAHRQLQVKDLPKVPT